MSDVTQHPLPPDSAAPPEQRHWLPQLRSRWWTVLLGLSLMANLLVLGLAVGAGFDERRQERIMGASYIQLIPRNFLRQLPRERRDALMDLVHDRLHQLRQLRTTSQASPLKLAEALEKDAATDADIQAAVDAFTTGSGSLAAGGAAVVMDIVKRLSPEERKLLAASIRERAAKAERRRRD